MTGKPFILINQKVRDNCKRAIDEAPNGYRVTISEARRSDQQNRLLWPLLKDLSDQVVWYGEHLSRDDWKDVLTASLRRARVVPGIDKGSFVPLGMRTSSMTKGEFSDLIELIYAFGAEHGVTWTETVEQGWDE